MIFLFVTKEKAFHPVNRLCRLLGVSTSGYYAWRHRGPSARSRRNAALTTDITRIHRASRGIYGAPRVHAELTLGQGIACGRKRVARLMRLAGLVGIHRRRHHGITRRDPRRPLFPDRVQRDFRPIAPNRLWVADLTQHRTKEGWLYAGVVLDAFSRRVIGWAMGDRPVADLAVNGLRMAVQTRRPVPGTIHHSDHGAQGGFNWSMQHLVMEVARHGCCQASAGDSFDAWPDVVAGPAVNRAA
ncbi:MAG: IS3 family transposase [Chloroflexi bacterium]|nr:IS3 family transposase [Chloroflexota bacterium]